MKAIGLQDCKFTPNNRFERDAAKSAAPLKRSVRAHSMIAPIYIQLYSVVVTLREIG